MQVKYTKHYLNGLEELFAESDYMLRYEKGNFKSGFCVLHDTKIVIINKYYTLEGRINSLIEILKTLKLDTSRFSPKSKKIFSEISQTELSL